MIKFREEKGFTLVEILITLLIVGIVFIPMIIFFNNSTVYTSEAGKRSQAIKIANSTMERVRLAAAKDWSSLTFDSSTNYLDTYLDKDKYSLKAHDFFVNIEVVASVDIDEDSKEDAKLVRVKVFWDEQERVVELSSLVMKR
ncbi:MAG: type II secretion system protein [Halanaerobiales bacterium]